MSETKSSKTEDADFSMDDLEAELFGDISKRVLPTGAELMSRPIKEGGTTRFDEEIAFVIKSTETRLRHIDLEERFQKRKWLLFAGGVISGIVGGTLICFGLTVTPFFESLEDTNMIAVGFGAVMLAPILVWFLYICAPNLNLKVFELERKKRALISMQRTERGSKNFFNQLQDEAAEATKPQPRVVKFVAHIRKHDYQIMATTWREAAEQVQQHSGLEVHRQVLRFNDNDLIVSLRDDVFDPKYGYGGPALTDKDRVYVYSKGGYATRYNNALQAEYAAMLEEDAALRRPKIVVKKKTFVRRLLDAIKPKGVKKVSRGGSRSSKAAGPADDDDGGGGRASSRRGEEGGSSKISIGGQGSVNSFSGKGQSASFSQQGGGGGKSSAKVHPQP